MAIPDRINFLQLGRYGCFSEQTYRNLFKNEIFDWFAFNTSIISKHLTGRRKAIAIDPSYIPKSGHKTPWMDARYWIITEPGFNWNFVLGTASSMQESPTVSLQTSENCIFT